MSVVESRNEVADPNGLPGGPASLVGNGSTVTQVSDPLAAAGTSYRMAHSSVATGGGLVVAGAVTPGQRWHGRAKFHRTSAELGARQFGCQLLFQDAAGNNLFDNLANAVVQSIPAGVFTRWTGTAGASSSERYEGTTKTVNAATNPFNGASLTNVNAVRMTATLLASESAVRGTVTDTLAGGLAQRFAPGGSPSASSAIRVEAGSALTIGAELRSTFPFLQLQALFYNSGGTIISAATVTSPQISATATGWAAAELKIPAVHPDAVSLLLYIGVGPGVTTKTTADTIDARRLYVGPPGAYFDGDTTNTGTGSDLASYDVALSAIAPAGAVSAVLYPYREQIYQATATDVTHVFNLMLTQADQDAPPPYGDGDRPGWFWSGARAASASYSLTAQGTVIEPDAGRMGVQLLDSKGVLWDLINGPVRLTRAGLKGLGLPEIVYFTSESAGLDGERVTGWRLKAREVFAPVRFKDQAMSDTTGLQRTFWDGLRIGKPIQIIVTDRDGAVRTLTMRLADDGGLSYKMSPDLIHVDSIGLGFTAADPWWYGPTVEASYTIGADTGADFFGGDANAPDFNIVSAGGSTATTMTNPGEEPMWLKWTIGGPSSQFAVGVGGKRISQSLVIPSGQWLRIDTDPRVQTAYLGSTKIPFRAFSELNFAPVPPGENVPITIDIVGEGIITAQGRPKYRRAL